MMHMCICTFYHVVSHELVLKQTNKQTQHVIVILSLKVSSARTLWIVASTRGRLSTVGTTPRPTRGEILMREPQFVASVVANVAMWLQIFLSTNALHNFRAKAAAIAVRARARLLPSLLIKKWRSWVQILAKSTLSHKTVHSPAVGKFGAHLPPFPASRSQ